MDYFLFDFSGVQFHYTMSQLIINANGFRNFKRTRNRILYCLNKYDKFTL